MMMGRGLCSNRCERQPASIDLIDSGTGEKDHKGDVSVTVKVPVKFMSIITRSRKRQNLWEEVLLNVLVLIFDLNLCQSFVTD